MDPNEVNLFLSETLAGQYRPVRHLSSGYFSGVFAAIDVASGEEVAAKVLRIGHCARADAVQEFRDEVELLTKLDGCDCVVDLLGSGQHTVHLNHALSGGTTIPVSTQFAVLEMASGSLTDLLLKGAALGWPDRLRLYRNVVKGVHQMHLRGIVHRDTKADNALVFEGPPRAKIADLGRSHDTAQPPRFAADLYVSGRGDLRFAPPEFLWGLGTQQPDDQALADLYLLGSLLFEVVTGVGLTATVIPDPLAVAQSKPALPPAARQADWLAHQPWLRDEARTAYETFEAQLPAAVSKRGRELLELLTDPTPSRRLPQSRRGALPTAWDLGWLLDRIDGLRRAVDPSLRRAYLAGRPYRRHTSRPTSRKT